MTKNYKNELPELTQLPENIYAVYIIPQSEYDGFWGKNGYMNYDLVFENKKSEPLGWCHWEGDVIHLFNNEHEYAMAIDTPADCGFIRIFSSQGLDIDGLFISSTTIKPKEREVNK